MSRLIDEDSFPETWKRTKEEQERLKGQKHKVMNALHPAIIPEVVEEQEEEL